MTIRRISPRRAKPAGCYVGKEDAFQRSAIAMVRSIAHPKGVDPRAIMHVPNGSKRPVHYGAFLKAQGMVAGYPDIMMFHPEGLRNMAIREGWGDKKVGLAIELKAWPNKPSEAQEAIHEILRNAGWKVVLCYGLGEVEAAVNEYLR